jgi:hypothetical protein
MESDQLIHHLCKFCVQLMYPFVANVCACFLFVYMRIAQLLGELGPIKS